MDIDIDNLLQTYDSTESSSNDLQRLQTLWTAELAAPELLPYPGELVERLMQRLRQQLDVIEGLGAEYTDAREGFKNVILQTEVERVKYLLRVYLRTRLSKIDKHPPQTEEEKSRLSVSEFKYTEAHQRMLHKHYLNSFLSEFPVKLQGMSDRDMSLGPDLDKAVIAKVRQDVPGLVEVGGGERVRMTEGDVFLVRWSKVREECVGMGGRERVELI